MTKTTRIMQQSICQLVEFPEHRVVEECATAMARTERDRKASSFRSPVDLQEPYIALVDMGKIIRHNRSDYVQKISSIIFRHNNATHITCVNDPYDTAYSTKDDKQDLRVQGRAHVPNIYMTHSHLQEHLKLALWHQQQREANMQTPHTKSTLLTLTALTCQPKINAGLQFQSVCPFSFLHMLYCLQWACCHRLS